MPEPRELLAEARQALRAAELLLEAGLYGDSVTRAYYAMLYAARSLLATKGVYPRTHGGTLRALGLHFVSPGLLPQDLARDFGLALESRQRADYGSLTAFPHDRALTILEHARRFLDTIEQLFPGSEG